MAATVNSNSMDHRVNAHSKTPFLIGVTGGTASGKSTVCAKIMEKLGQDSVVNRERRVVCVSQNSFYRELTAEEKALAFKGNFDFDHPSAFDEVLMLNTLRDILDAKVVNVPRYNYKEHTVSGSDTVYPADVVLFEGILLFYFPEIRELFHMKLFVDTDSDTRLSRRVLHDVKERNRDLETVLNQYTNFVKPAFEEFCQPTKKYADVIIPRGADNGVAVDLIVNHIESLFDYCDDLHSCCNNEDTNNSSSEASDNVNCKCIKCLAIDLIVQTIKDLLQNRRVRTQSPLSPPPNLLAQMDQFRRSHDSPVVYARSSSVGPQYGNR